VGNAQVLARGVKPAAGSLVIAFDARIRLTGRAPREEDVLLGCGNEAVGVRLALVEALPQLWGPAVRCGVAHVDVRSRCRADAVSGSKEVVGGRPSCSVKSADGLRIAARAATDRPVGRDRLSDPAI
jgi:hypothetical protein